MKEDLHLQSLTAAMSLPDSDNSILIAPYIIKHEITYHPAQ